MLKKGPNKTYSAIMFSDIVGYTALMGENEDLAFRLVKENTKIHQQIIKNHHGRLIKELGDGVLCAFPSCKEAVEAARDLQTHYLNSKVLKLRIGIHYGEVILDGNDVFGDAVNIASRVQTLGLPGSVLFSKEIQKNLENITDLHSISLGHFSLKNVKEPVEIFALTNKGLVIPKRGEMLKLLESRVKKFLTWGFILMTLGLVVFGIYHQSSMKKIININEKSIAVLPFYDIEYSEVNDSLNFNLTDNLINGLSKISSFIVIDTASSKKYNIQNQPVNAISNKLRVKYLVTGNTYQNGENRKINIKLYEAGNEDILWSEDFPVGDEMQDILELNRQIILQISKRLDVKLTVLEMENLNSNPTESQDAYLAFLSGKKKYQKYDRAENQEAIREFKKALRLSPNFKEAYQGLADAYAQNYYYYGMGDYWIDSSIYFSNAALKIDQMYSDAYLSLGSASYFKFDYPEAVGYFKKAISINSNNSRALANLGSTLMVLGKIDSSLIYLDKSVKLNPQSFISFQNIGWNYRLLKDYENAICWLEESIKIKPTLLSFEQLAYAYIGLNDLAAAKEVAEKILNFDVEEKNKRELAGMIYFLCKDFEKAYLNFNFAYQIDPNQLNCEANPMVMYLGYLEKIIKKNTFKSEILIEGCKAYLDGNIKAGSQDPEIFFDLVKYYAIKEDLNNCLISLKEAEIHHWNDIFFLTHNPIFDVFNDEPEFKRSVNNQDMKVDLKRKNSLKINNDNLNKGTATFLDCYK
jgi:class 3 adenylate cyclase/TolB-like protein/Flp pilus assembly protein TadD